MTGKDAVSTFLPIGSVERRQVPGALGYKLVGLGTESTESVAGCARRSEFWNAKPASLEYEASFTL
jgi:hypothetical protein